MNKPYRIIGTQQGWTFWSMVFVMSIVLFFSYVGLQLVPIYLANDSIKTAMMRSIEDKDPSTISRTIIIRKMSAQLYLDGNHNILNYKTDVKVKRSRSELIVETHYVREVPLFFNLTLRAKFDNVESRNLKG